jgi:hypothetical protein
MAQLTVTDLDEELQARLRRLVEEQGISLEKAAIHLLRLGAGIDAPRARRVHRRQVRRGGTAVPAQHRGDRGDEEMWKRTLCCSAEIVLSRLPAIVERPCAPRWPSIIQLELTPGRRSWRRHDSLEPY